MKKFLFFLASAIILWRFSGDNLKLLTIIVTTFLVFFSIFSIVFALAGHFDGMAMAGGFLVGGGATAVLLVMMPTFIEWLLHATVGPPLILSFVLSCFWKFTKEVIL